MKPRTCSLLAILFGLGVQMGLILGYWFSRSPTVSVAIAITTIPQGTILAIPEDWVVIQQYLEGTEPKAAVKDPNALRGKKVMTTIGAGEALTDRNVEYSSEP